MSDIIRITDRDDDVLEFSTETETYPIEGGTEQRTTLSVTLRDFNVYQTYITADELRNLATAMMRWADDTDDVMTMR